MQLAGIAPREALGLVRDARRSAEAKPRLTVTGVLAAELGRSLRGDAGADDVIGVGGDPVGATAVIVVIAGVPTADDERVMRAATRARVPVVAVQADHLATAPLAYVTAGSVIVCPPGRGFPVDEIASTLARELGSEAIPLARALPRLREPILHELVRQASFRAALAGALPWRKGADFPVLAMIQARLVLDVAAAYGHEPGQQQAPELAAVAGTGLGFRALVRRLPTRVPLVGGLTGYLGTRALGEAALKRYSGPPSVRSGS
jgi:uncharacterized protein (DUF697 family)